MSTVTAPQTQHAQTEHARTETEAPRRLPLAERSLPARYTGAMLYFMGAALIAGGVVHMPLDPPRYTIITVVGMLVFLLGTIVNEFVLSDERTTVGRAAWVVTVSLFLSFGVGLLGGGIQHFEQFPELCAIFTPTGILMSYVAFVAKDKDGGWRNIFGWFGAGVLALAVATWFGMTALAGTPVAGGHDHGGDSGHHGTADQPADRPADAPGDRAPAGQAPAEGDGHTGHQH